MTEIEKVAKKFAVVGAVLPERARRLWVGAEADALGHGGVAWVAKATGVAISTVRKGRDEFRRGVVADFVGERRSGGGRRRLEKSDLELVPLLESLVHPTTRGDPESPLRWVCKSVRTLARELSSANHPVSASKVGQLLRTLGYSLQAAAKTKEGADHPDRNAQFEFINARAADFLSRGLPVISVDAKKKEAIGEHADRGREWQLKGKPVEVLSHEFFDSAAEKAIPYGIYDVAHNSGFVNVGTDHNTPSFAVRSIEKWWELQGHKRYPDAKDLLITADAGGSNAVRSRVWKAQLQELADKTGVRVHVSHFPPGTSKWNKIEHRLFSFITMNWRGRPLVSYDTVVALISATTTTKGLRVHAELDDADYPVGQTASAQTMRRLALQPAAFHADWNYSLHPRTAAEIAAAAVPHPVLDRIRKPQAETQENWARLFREQLQSGESQRQFCRKRGISVGAFYAARRRSLRLIRAKPRAGK